MNPFKECLFPLFRSSCQCETRLAIDRLFFQDIENIVFHRHAARFRFGDNSLFNFGLEI